MKEHKNKSETHERGVRVSLGNVLKGRRTASPLRKFGSEFGLRLLPAIALSLVMIGSAAGSQDSKSFFEIRPYLQLGNQAGADQLTICFAVKDNSQYKLEYKQGEASSFHEAKQDSQHLYTKPKLSFFLETVSAIKPGENIQYRILRDNTVIFEESAKAPLETSHESRTVIFGDIASGTKEFNELTHRIADSKPDLVMLTGDLIQPAGTASEYLDNFFPSLNSSAPGDLMSQTVFTACPGDRDISADKYDAEHDNRKLDTVIGGMAYYCLWKQPLNGPGKTGAKNVPVPQGTPQHVDEFTSAAGKSYPGGANYSFDWGDAHWLVLDGGAYVDWRDKDWRNWVKEDLAGSKKTWKFVAIHQPGFSSDTTHGEEQRMRLLCDLFEQGGVDLVFSAHSNSYQRSCPLHFSVIDNQDTDRESKLGFVYGKYKLDKSFDGETKTQPDGIIYIISGGGGAEPRAERRIQDDPSRWQPFTRKFYCASNSFSLLDINGKQLDFKQIAADGTVVDSIKISK